jgi:hypothetical protein
VWPARKNWLHLLLFQAASNRFFCFLFRCGAIPMLRPALRAGYYPGTPSACICYSSY